jgi:asparagine synthase (glutamine-hydrolysing)
MGAFFFIHGGADEPGQPRRDQLAESFRRQGFGAGTPIERPRWRAVCYAPLVTGAATACSDPAGDQAFCAGTLFYRGLAKAPALARLLADHKDGDIDEAQLYGSFAALLAVGDTAVVMTDRTATFQLYATADRRVLSTSFLALAESLPARSIDARAVYDYVFHGAPMGGATVFDQIRLFPDAKLGVFDAEARLEERSPIRAAQRRYATLDDAASHCVELLRARFRALPAHWPEIDTALSGGYDSRLLLALARDAGLNPRVHVYGRDSDPDVRCAKAIAAAEGFVLDHQDKSTVPQPDPDRFGEVVRSNYLAFDGYPTDGIFDNGTDLATRRKRVGGGALMLNGGGGEIFRNFFYLPDRPLSALELVWTFYCQFDPRTCTARFDERAYLNGLAEQIAARIGGRPERLTRRQIEAVYPLFRCSYWMGRNNSLNNRLGHAWTPFIDAAIIPAALDVPLDFKNLGRLEGRMIEMLAPRLAGHPSAYGRPFDQPPGGLERLKGLANRWRPPRLRRLAYRLRRRTTSPWTGALDRARLERVIDLGFPVMGRYFVMDRVADPAQLSRICTLEHLFGQLTAETE